jgi:hypothetical protein
MSRHALLLPLLALACRTSVDTRPTPPKAEVYVPRTGCDVHDYPAATDLPDGAKNLGWVQVPVQAQDEETYLMLRKAICDMGGDALSQLAWTYEPGRRQAVALKANAWLLP